MGANTIIGEVSKFQAVPNRVIWKKKTHTHKKKLSETFYDTHVEQRKVSSVKNTSLIR